MADKNVLSISTLIDEKDRDFVIIDKKQYFFVKQEEMDIVEGARIALYGKELDEFQSKIKAGEASVEVCQKMQDIADATASLVLLGSEEIINKLNGAQRLRVVNAFLIAVANRSKAQPQEKAPEKEKVSAK